MLTYVAGDLFASPAQVLVNTVNTVGVMGKGIAKEFKARYPEMYAEYHAYCESGAFNIGNLILYRSTDRWILNFPTKRHWRGKSRLADIEIGLAKFVEQYQALGIFSIAFPQLGCGNGQLDWETEVRPLMERYLADLPIHVFIHVRDDKPGESEHALATIPAERLTPEPVSSTFSGIWDEIVKLVHRHPQHEWSVVGDADSGTLRWTPGNTTVDASQVFDLWHQARTFGYISVEDVALDRRTAAAFFSLLQELVGFEPVRFRTIGTTLGHVPVADRLRNTPRGLSYTAGTFLPAYAAEPDSGVGSWSESPTTKQLQLSLTA